MLGKIFPCWNKKPEASAARFETPELMEAVVGGTILVACAERLIEFKELKFLARALCADRRLGHFKNVVPYNTVMYRERMEISLKSGKDVILNELHQIKGDKAGFVLSSIVSASTAYQQLTPAQVALLAEISRVLGVCPGMYGPLEGIQNHETVFGLS